VGGIKLELLGSAVSANQSSKLPSGKTFVREVLHQRISRVGGIWKKMNSVLGPSVFAANEGLNGGSKWASDGRVSYTDQYQD
jgi:hypothetical protein